MKEPDPKPQLMSFLEIDNMKDIGTANPIELTKTLINCRSVTPENDGAIEQVSYWLEEIGFKSCLLYTSPSPRDQRGSRMPSSA